MDVAVGDARFDRHFRRIHVALRLMSHGARAQTVSELSGLSPDQVVGLRRRWLPDVDEGFRGPAPTSFQPFFRSVLRSSHAALFVSIHRVVGIPFAEPSLEGAERLCEAVEIFCEWAPEAELEFDQAVLLAKGVVTREAVELVDCVDCGCSLLVDKLGVFRESCGWCRRRPAREIKETRH